MQSYLTAETSFVRAFGNRCLLLLFLCALSRTGDKLGSASALGLSLNISPGLIVVYGPLLALVLLIALKVENDALYLCREAVLAELSALPVAVRRTSKCADLLFWVPSLAAAFLILQYVKEIVPADATCAYPWWKPFVDFDHFRGTPSLYCIRDIRDGMPWIYPPLETYSEILCLVGCVIATFAIRRTWSKARGSAYTTKQALPT